MAAKLGPIPRFNTIGRQEWYNVSLALKKPLSGYLGGVRGGGYWVERLSAEWCEKFNVKHAVPCNSATSGLLAACMAAGIDKDSTVWVPAMSMSATAACAKVLGARIVFIDIETVRYSMNMNNFRGRPPKAIIVTNLFGHPAYLSAMRTWCDCNNVIMIEDNAQSILAKENGRYAGTIGHIGVFSLNVHKHIQSGEGGIIVTNDSDLESRIQGTINHGELSQAIVGLNLRMTEVTAAIACAQLSKVEKIVAGRIELAEAITDMVEDIPWIIPPRADVGCTHSYYIWAARIINGAREEFVHELNEHGFPMRERYSPTLNRIFNANQSCPVAEKLEDEELISFDICSHDPSRKQLRIMKDIVHEAAENI